MKKLSLLIGLMLATMLALTACDGALPGTESDAPPAEEDTAEYPAEQEVVEAPQEPAGIEKTIYVGPEMVDCEGEGPQQCLLVKEDPNAEYQLHYFDIQGFTFEPGYEYELIIREDQVENPPAGGSSLEWTLVQEVSRTPVEASTDEEPAEGSGRIVAAYVGPELVDCVGVAPQKCMLVKTNPDDDYGFFYDPIEGFEFEEGYEYELRVLVEPVANPPADASALKYTLIEEVSKTPVTTEAPATEETVEASEPTLEGPIWRLSNYVDLAGEAQAVLPDTRITLSFEGDQVSGTAGCNSYFGPYTVDGDAMTIGPLGSTLRACFPDEVMLQETAYLANLGQVAHWEFVDGRLELSDENFTTILIFDAEVATTLTGVVWDVTNYNNGRGGVTTLVLDTAITAIFTEEGTVGGSAGCNNYRATYEVDGNNMSVGPAAVTRKLCAEPEGIMEQEAEYLAALGLAATFEIEDTTMSIFDADGARLATLVAGQPVAELLQDNAALASSDAAGTPADEAVDSAAAAETVNDLAIAGTSWQWLQMITPVEEVSVDDPTLYQIEFTPEGSVAVQADCNSGTGTYEASGGSLSINITATTLALCPEDSLSDLFIRSLNAAAIYFEQDGNLFIDLFADAGTMEFAPNS